MKENISAVILAYRSESNILENIAAVLGEVRHIYLVINEVSTMPLDVLTGIRKISEVTIIENTDNVGVAEGFNRGLRASLKDGFDFTLVFDQDSQPTSGFAEKLINGIHRDPKFFGVIGPALRDKKSQKRSEKEVGTGVKRVSILISSGTLFSRFVLEKAGFYDPSLFIDYVDHDYCLKVAGLGGQVLKCYDAVLDHQFGSSEILYFFGRPFFSADYSPLRHFYMARNRIRTLKKYGYGPWFSEDLGYFIKYLVKVILFEDRKILKLKAILVGTWRGFFN